MLKNTILLFTILFSNFVFANVIVGKGTISYVVDGDTFDVQVYDSNSIQELLNADYVGFKHVDTRKNTFRIRLANINTEESKHKNSEKNTQFGSETSEVVKQTFTGKEGEFRCYKKGNYDRAICSFITERNIDMGYWLIENEYSPYVKNWGRHPEFHREYVKAVHSRSNQGYDLGNALAGERHRHRDNDYHNGHGHNDRQSNHREDLNHRVVDLNERYKLIILRAEESQAGRNLEGFLNRGKQQMQSGGNLDMFLNRNN